MARDHVYIVRHAIAEDLHPAGDEARALTKEGRELFRRHAEKAARHLHLDAIVTSPLVRAVQTAELLAQASEVDDIRVAAELAPGRDAARKIAQFARTVPRAAALVGHEPSLSHATALLLGLDALPFRLRKGSIIALERTKNGPWTLVWRWKPGGKRKSSD